MGFSECLTGIKTSMGAAPIDVVPTDLYSPAVLTYIRQLPSEVHLQ